MKHSLFRAALLLLLLPVLLMAQTTIPLAASQSFPVGDTTSAAATVPAGTHGAIATFNAGPMADPATHFVGRVLVDKQDGKGFVDAGVGLEGWGGLYSKTRGGTPDTPVTINAEVNMPLSPGWKIEAQVHVDGTVAVTASVSATTY